MQETQQTLAAGARQPAMSEATGSISVGRRDAAGTLLGMGMAPQPADDNTKRKRPLPKSAKEDWFCICGDKYKKEDDHAGMWIECNSCGQPFCPKKE